MSSFSSKLRKKNVFKSHIYQVQQVEVEELGEKKPQQNITE